MTRMLALVLLLALVCLPVSAAEFSAPTVPDSGRALMPEDTADFGKALMELVRKALTRLRPDLAQCARVCAGVLGAAMLTGLLRCFSGTEKGLVNLAGVLVVSALLGTTANSMISLGRETIGEISNYGKLLLPVMTAALAAQGGVSTSAALYVGTAAFDTALGGVIANLLIPMVYGFLVLGIGVCALGEPTLGKLQELVKSLVTWTLKTMLIVFTSYMGITAQGDAAPQISYSNIEIGGGRITGTEYSPEHPEGISFGMYHTGQYAAPDGEHQKVFSADGVQWYKQYAADTVIKTPFTAPDGEIDYHKEIVKKMPDPPKRKDRM